MSPQTKDFLVVFVVVFVLFVAAMLLFRWSFAP